MKKIYIIMFVVAILVIIVALTGIEKPLYGNDTYMIIDSASRLEYLEGKNIEILDWIDIGDVRIVSLLSNGYPTVMEFRINEKNDYVWQFVQTYEDNLFNYIAYTNVGSGNTMIVSIRNSYEDIDSFKFIANDYEYLVRFDESNPNVQYTLLKESEENGYKITWLFE